MGNDFAESERLGDYRILREIGRGGMGIVYEAEQVSLGRRVALKLLPPTVLFDARQKRRFEREARAAAKLHHTNIVPIFGVGEHYGQPYLVMQYIEGLGLDAVLTELRRRHESEFRGRSSLKATSRSDDAPALSRMARQMNPTIEALEASGSSDAESDIPAQPARGPSELSAAAMAGALLTCSFNASPGALGLGGEVPPSLPSPASDGAGPQDAPLPAEEGVGPTGPPAPSSSATTRLEDSFARHSSEGLLSGAAGSSASGARSRRNRLRTYWHSVAQLGAQVAGALQYAHQHGILHRDIKPSNLLLDSSGAVWVLDFGLAKADDQQDLTRPGDVIGTLRYIPPEAFEHRADARGDIYSLGLTLYELLAFRPAFDERQRHKLLKQVTNSEPPPLAKLNRAIPRDLHTIVHKAIDRDPARRYQTAGELAADLERFIEGQPIAARRLALAERLGRWTVRHKGLAVALTFIALLLLATAVVSTIGLLLVSAANDREHLARVDAEKQRDSTRYHLYVSNMNLAQREWQDGHAAHTRELLDLYRPSNASAAAQSDLRGWEWYYLDRLCHDSLRVFSGHTGPVRAVAYSPDGAQLASAGEDNTVRIWHAATGKFVHLLRGHTDLVIALVYSPDGRQLASAGNDGTIRIWDPARGVGTAVLNVGHGVIRTLAYSADGARLASAGADGTIRLWDAANAANTSATDGKATTEEQLPGYRGSIGSVAFSPDGAYLACGGSDGAIQIWNRRSAAHVVRTLRGHTDSVWCVTYSPDGSRLASSGTDGTIRIWDVADLNGAPQGPPKPNDAGGQSAETFQPVRVLIGHRAWVPCIAYSPDGTRLISSGEDGTVRIWDAAAGEMLAVCRGHTGTVPCVAFSPDGSRIASGGEDRSVRVWDAGVSGFAADVPWTASVLGQDTAILRAHAGAVGGVAYSPDGGKLATAGEDGMIRIWDTVTHQVLHAIAGCTGGGLHAIFNRDGSRLAWTDHRGIVRLWTPGSGAEPQMLHGHTGGVRSVIFDPSGTQLASAGADGTIRIWDAVSGAALRVMRLPSPISDHIPLDNAGPTLWIESLAYSPDGTQLASGGEDGAVRIWDPLSGLLLATVKDQVATVKALAYSPDGSRLVSAGNDATVRIRDANSLRVLHTLKGHTEWLTSVAYSRDGERLASAGHDRTIRIWDPASGEAMLVLRGHAGVITGLAFSPDSTRLASASEDGTVEIADARPWTPEQQDATEALDLVQALFARPLLKAEVIAAIERHKGITDDVRRIALELASRFQDDADNFQQAARGVVRHQHVSPSLYRQALAWAQTACRLAELDQTPIAKQYHASCLTTAGIAQYRLGAFNDALTMLNRSTAMRKTPEPTDLAFLAMTHAQLGHRDEARALLEELRKLLGTRSDAPNAEVLGFVAEAAALIGK